MRNYFLLTVWFLVFPPTFNEIFGGDFSEGFGGVKIMEFKSFHCGPCKTLKERVIDPVKEHYRWSGKVEWDVTFGKINSLDEPTTVKAYCAVKSGALPHDVLKTLFNYPESEVSYLAMHTMVLESDINNCINSGLGKNFYLNELNKVRSSGVTSFPTLFINGSKVRTPSTDQELINMIENL